MGGVLEKMYTTYQDASACAKDANYSQTIRIARSHYFLFPLKLIDADHGLHTSSGVQISCFSEMLTVEGLGGLVPMLKFGSEMESMLHYVNSDDDP